MVRRRRSSVRPDHPLRPFCRTPVAVTKPPGLFFPVLGIEQKMNTSKAENAVHDRRHRGSPPIDRINDRYGRREVGFGLFPSGVRAFKVHAAFHRVPEGWGFSSSLERSPRIAALMFCNGVA
jgi:hypothetical protein